MSYECTPISIFNTRGSHATPCTLQVIQLPRNGRTVSPSGSVSVTEPSNEGRTAAIRGKVKEVLPERSCQITRAPAIASGFDGRVKHRPTIEKNLTLNRVVEISAFKISGSYLVLDEDPENTFQREKRGKKKKEPLPQVKPVLSLECTNSESKIYMLLWILTL